MAADARIGLLLEDRYRIEKRIAAGGMGVVYRAERVGLAKRVAVKFMHKSSALVSGHRQRFMREAAAMARLTHPNLVSVFDYGVLDSVPYLVMEYHEGDSLRRVLRTGAMEPERAIYLARQILAGAASAHQVGVVHRDLKPANVLLVGSPGEDLVKILDFGVAKLVEGSGRPSSVSVLGGSLLGTPEYMSPEQARAEPVDRRADLYAVGVILYQMLTGRRPFVADGDLAVLRKQVEEAPVPPRKIAPHLSEELEALVLRALEKERDRRFQSAPELARALARAPEGGAFMPRSAGVPVEREVTHEVIQEASSFEEERRRPRRVLAVALLILFLLAGAGVAGWVALERGWVAMEWPSWLPWKPGEEPGASRR